jgi:hypothetical protein
LANEEVRGYYFEQLCGRTAMTYNFDPDRWYDIEIGYLELLRQSGKITESEFKQSLEELDKRHQVMWNRLDGTYRLSHGCDSGDEVRSL